LIQAAVGFSGGSGGFLTKVLGWIERPRREFFGGLRRPRGLTVVDLVWRHQADATMVVILIIPIEEAAAEGLRILDAAEPLRKLGLIF